METQMERGVLVSGGVVNIAAAAAANAAAIFQVSNFAQQIGTKSFKPRKLLVRNNAGGTLWLSLGTGVGVGFADALPPVRVMNNLDSSWGVYIIGALVDILLGYFLFLLDIDQIVMYNINGGCDVRKN